MIKYIIVSVAFFIFEIWLFSFFGASFSNVFLSVMPSKLNVGFSQQKALDVSRNILDANKKGEPAFFILGGCTVDLYKMSPFINANNKKYKIYDMSVNGQDFLDKLRLIENIKIKDAIIVFTTYPWRFFMPVSETMATKSKYIGGNGAKYPLPSSEIDNYYFEKGFRTKEALLKLIPSLNVYGAIINDHLDFRHYFGFLDKSNFLIHNSKPSVKKSEEEIKKQFFKNISNNLWKNTEIKSNIIVNMDLFKRIMEIIKQKNYKLVLFDLPYSSEYNLLINDKVTFLNKELSMIKKEFPEISHYQFSHRKTSKEYYYFRDSFHLTDKGLEKFQHYFTQGLQYAVTHSK